MRLIFKQILRNIIFEKLRKRHPQVADLKLWTAKKLQLWNHRYAVAALKVAESQCRSA
jgi:hypothetical protein